MRYFERIVLLTMVLAFGLSCSKEGNVVETPSTEGKEQLVFATEVETRAVTECTTNNLSNELRVWGVSGDMTWRFRDRIFSKNYNETYYTNADIYRPSSGTTTYYAVNRDGIYRYDRLGSGMLELYMDASGNEDVVTAYTTPQTASVVVLTFKHAFARLYQLTFTNSTPTGATLTITSVRADAVLTGWKRMGYDSSWDGLSAPETAWTYPYSVSVPRTSAGRTITGDFLCVPGPVTITVDYDVTIGGTTRSYTKSSTVNLNAGEKTTVKGALSSDLQNLVFQTTVSAWDETIPVSETS